MVAKILISESDITRDIEIEKILQNFSLGLKNPDVYLFEDEKTAVEQAKKIKSIFGKKSFLGGRKAVILKNGSNLSTETQNTLLKTLEELPEESIFIICALSESQFLPTVLSRCEVVRIKSDRSEYQQISEIRKSDIERLINSTIEERFEFIEKLKEREELLHTLVQYFHVNLASHLEGGNVKFLKELLQAEQWAKQNVNTRAILEYLMLIMPKISQN